ncbi:MAG TPA: ABC transporter substrate-binding protein [Gemmatimonadaceae bacterium]|nr:ABC transporter substrate-binding protein [Gemmatimonadaceae bacterium]
MPRLPRAVSLVLCAVCALAACGRFADRSTRATQHARVVSVSKQINEFLYAIGGQSDLVAVDLTSIYPPEIRTLPTVGYHRALSAEGIISMRPTLFLTDGNVGPDAVLQQLRAVGIPIEVMRPGGTLDSAEILLTNLGRYFHREQAADSVLARWKTGMSAVWADTARWNSQRRPRVLLMHFGQIINNYLAVNRGSPADQMIRWAGGENAMDSLGGMTRITPELIARAAPDVIIATEVGFDRYGDAKQFAAMPGISLTPAGRSGRIYRITEQEVMYFGPRTPATVKKIAAMLHP